MSSLSRMLAVLDLFSSKHVALGAEEIAAMLGLARTTCYRYTKELANAGLLVSDAGLFRLGPRIIQLDRRIRETDPLLTRGREVLVPLADSVGAAGLLSTIYSNEVINIHEYGGEHAFRHVTYGRGSVIPMFRSASSRVILAALSRARLQRIWKDNTHLPECQLIGATWLAFWQALQEVRHSGYYVSRGEVDAGLVGIAAPVFYDSGEVAGSMTLIFQSQDFDLFNEVTLAERLTRATNEVTRGISQG